MTSPDEQVCPRCGQGPGEQRFCSTCGLRVAEPANLPTRREWEAAQPQASENFDAEHRGASGGQQPVSVILNPTHLDSIRTGLRVQSKGRQVAIVATVVIVLLIAIGGVASAIRSPGLTYNSTCSDWNGASRSAHVGFMQQRGFNDITTFNLVTASQAADLLSAACSGASTYDPSSVGVLADQIVGNPAGR